MKYERPEMDIIEFKVFDIVKTSPVGAKPGGEGGSIEDEDYFG